MDIYLQDNATCGAEETNSAELSLLRNSETIPMLECEYTETEHGLCAQCEYDRRCERLCGFMGQSIEHPCLEAIRPIPNDTQERLCSRCRHVQWNKASGIMLPEPAWGKFLFTVNETREDLLASHCPICQYIGFMKNSDSSLERVTLNMKCLCSILSGHGISRHHTEGFDHSPVFRLESYNNEDQNWEIEGKFGVLHPWSEHDHLAPRHVDPEKVDYSIIRQWIRTCEESHEETCTSQDMQNVPGFKVIDCQTKEVVEMLHQTCHYAALSYTWGNAPSTNADRIYPKTIRDAIEVCTALGYRYLWVDFYCINQQNAVEKRVQIQMMNFIYSQAQLTIVAAAGKDPTYGLPGVSTTARNPQHRLRLGDVELVQIFQSAQDIFESKWASRGWTFQEGYLSRRRLMFTDSEVMFLCDRMCCQESIRRDIHSHFLDTPQGISCETLEGIFPMTSEAKRDEVTTNSLLAEYDNRDLSYSEDVLNACQGILEGFHIQHLWGVPIKKTSWWDESTPPLGTATLELWWKTEKPGRRRDSFPTWSWTGWSGVKSFYDSGKHYADTCFISFLAPDGCWRALDNTSLSSAKGSEDNPAQSISITGPACPIKSYIVDQVWVEQHMPGYKTYHRGPFAVFSYSETVDIFATIQLDEERAGFDVSPDAVGLTINKHKKYKFRHTMLVLVPDEDQYKRIGILECLRIGVFKDKKDWTDSRKFLQRQDCPFWMKDVTMRTIYIK